MTNLLTPGQYVQLRRGVRNVHRVDRQGKCVFSMVDLGIFNGVPIGYTSSFGMIMCTCVGVHVLSIMWIGGSGACQISIPGFFALFFGICHTNLQIPIMWIVSGKNHQKIEFFGDPGKIARKLETRPSSEE
jgi:uncharacterized membrane protein (Fun14 family)